MKENRYRYSEIFGRTVQGEGVYTGVLSSWLRLFSCNLECNGFGQKEPTKPETYELPYKKIDVKNIHRLEDLPVFEYGCDSSYSWAKQYRHLAHIKTAAEICDEIEAVTASEFNPLGKFKHPLSGQDIHFVATGGEPLLQQRALVEIIHNFSMRDNFPNYVTIETNGTQEITEELTGMINGFYTPHTHREWFWSVSPKLFTTSGERNEDAIHPEVVAGYAAVSNRGQLKFVVNGTDESWKEMEDVLRQFRRAGVSWDVWVMPVGATREEQEEIQAKVCEQAFDRGYNFSPRLQAWIFANVIGK